jgi:hypothetical protein
LEEWRESALFIDKLPGLQAVVVSAYTLMYSDAFG